MPSLAEMIGQMILVGFHGTFMGDSSLSPQLANLDSLPPPTMFQSIKRMPSEAVALNQRPVTISGSANISPDYATIPSMNLKWTTVLRAQIQQGHVGGVIFYGYNIEKPDQTGALTAAFRDAVTPTQPPLLVAIDVEGGKVNRLTEAKGFGPNYLSAHAQEKLSDQEVMQNVHRMATTLAKYGFNLNFAPVVDLHDPAASIIGGLERAFSDDPQRVADLARITIAGHHSQGVLTSCKHFPGHSFAHGDSHAGMVDVTPTARPDVELLPYQLLNQESQLDTVMTAHVFNKNWDPHFPATLSPEIIQKYLRAGSINFEGVVIADDLHMGAIQEFCLIKVIEGAYSSVLEASVIMAINAGVDILMFSNNPNAAKNIPDFQPDPFLPERVLAIVQKAIADGHIQSSQIEKSYQRIMALKRRLLDRKLS